MIFFTSDTHFCHPLIAKLRGYKSFEEMNEIIINNWNTVVGKKDLTYHLGDFGFSHDSLAHIRHRLKGKIIIILGNHDLKNKVMRMPVWTDIFQMKTIQIDKQPIALCHYPFDVWDRSHYNSYHLYGHVHGGLNPHVYEPKGKKLDIGWDKRKQPMEWSDLKVIFEGLPDNPNLIKRT